MGRSRLPRRGAASSFGLVLLALALSMAVVGSRPAPARADTLTWLVATQADAPRLGGAFRSPCLSTLPGNPCTLRAALEEINVHPATDSAQIRVPAGHYTLASGQLVLTGHAALAGAGAGATLIDGNMASRVLEVHDGATLDLSGATLENGKAAGDGGALESCGTTALTDVVVSGSRAQAASAATCGAGTATARPGAGGGIAIPRGSLTMTGGGLTNNNAFTGADGGAISVGDGTTTQGSATLRRTVVSGNFAGRDGGGVQSSGGSITVVESSITGNTATSFGGGVSDNGQAATLVSMTNVTVAGNVGNAAGGIALSGGAISLLNVTAATNSAQPMSPSNLYRSPTANGAFSLKNTIVSGGTTSSPDCQGSFTSQGHNLDRFGTCMLAGPGDLKNIDPLLGPLQDNGGPGPTLALLPGSPAIGAGDSNGCPATDERGVTRPAGQCDIGAYQHSGSNLVGNYRPVAPYRVLDTRGALGGHPGQLGPNQALTLQIAGTGGAQGVPATGAGAVSINVTVTNASANSYLTVFPGPGNRPVASNLNFSPFQTIANLVMVQLGDAGKVNIYNSEGAVDVLVDVQGWVTAAPSGNAGRYNPLPAPHRILDTRGSLGGHPGPLGPNSTLDLAVAGTPGVPATGVAAVVLNLTAVNGTSASYLTAYPGPGSRPDASNVSFPAFRNLPNRVMVKLSDAGHILIYNSEGAADVVVDVAGWLSGDSVATGGLYHPLDPQRIYDSRALGKVGPGEDRPVQVSGLGGLPNAGLGAVVTNMTVTEPEAASFLTVHPSDQQVPQASDLNYQAGDTVPNLAVVKLGPDGKVKAYNDQGATHLLVDVEGWWG